MKDISTLGIDLAKNSFYLHGVNKNGEIALKKKVSRSKLLYVIANLPKCLIGIEACCGSNYWAREMSKFGHTVKLMAPQYVKPYVKTNKNDMSDAEAICEAVSRPNMRFVPQKTKEAQDIQCIHRVRQRLVRNRTAVCCEIRGLLQEFGLAIPKGINQLRKALKEILENSDEKLTIKMLELVRDLYEEIINYDRKIKEYEKKIDLIYDQNKDCQRIGKIPGIGKITATIIIAAIGDGSAFKNGRQFSAWLGLVPKQYSTGGKDRLYGISKRGDKYIRSLLVHGARVVVNWAQRKDDPKSSWINRVKDRRGVNKATVALANKNARVIWSLIYKDQDYKAAA